MDCSDSVESSRKVATPRGSIGMIAAVAAAAVAGGPATTGDVAAGGPMKVFGDGVVVTTSFNTKIK